MDSVRPDDSLISQDTLEPDSVRLVKLNFPAKAEVLHPTQERFVYWTPALLYLWGGFETSMLAKFNQTCGVDITYYHHRFDAAVFSGLDAVAGDNAWNYVLWAIEREHWEALVDFICSSMLTCATQKLVVKYAMQTLDVVDPLVAQRGFLSGSPPLMPVHIFGIKTNQWTAAIDIEKLNPLVQLPALRFFEADNDCKMYAEQLYPEPSGLRLEHFKHKSKGLTGED